MMTETWRTRRWFWLTASLFGFLTVAFLVWVTLRLGGGGLSDAVDDVGELLAALVAGAACSVAARRLERSRRAWGFLAASSFAWAAGEAVWSYYDLYRGVTLPFPSLADVGFLAAVPLAVVGLRSFPGQPRPESSQLGGHLGRKLGGFAGFFVLSVMVVGAARGVPIGAILEHVVGLAYPVSDVVMVSVVAMAARRERRHRTSLFLVLAGLLAFTLADTSFAYLTAGGSYGAGNALDTGWVLGYLLVALGALWAFCDPASAASDASRARWPIPGHPLSMATAGAPGRSVEESVIVLRSAYMKPSWFTKAAADQIVYAGCVLLMATDAAISLYDLAQLAKLR
jgi:diguanylate cyclase